jgi:hypothetical protein
LNLSLGMADAAEARERVVMPFDCGLEQGRIKLSSAVAARAYDIVGKREVATVTSCSQPRSGSCHRLMVHRFDISCGGAGIAWMRVAAAMCQATSEPAWIEQGRLNVVWAAHNPSAHAPCLERPTYALGGMALERRVAYTGNCESRGDDYEHVVLPAGFAPVAELGARIESAADASLSSELDEIAASFQPALAGLDEPVLALASPDDIVAPIPGLEPYDAEIDPVVADDWVTVVRSVQDYGIKKADSTPNGSWAWLLALMAAAVNSLARWPVRAARNPMLVLLSSPICTGSVENTVRPFRS